MVSSDILYFQQQIFNATVREQDVVSASAVPLFTVTYKTDRSKSSVPDISLSRSVAVSDLTDRDILATAVLNNNPSAVTRDAMAEITAKVQGEGPKQRLDMHKGKASDGSSPYTFTLKDAEGGMEKRWEWRVEQETTTATLRSLEPHWANVVAKFSGIRPIEPTKFASNGDIQTRAVYKDGHVATLEFSEEGLRIGGETGQEYLEIITLAAALEREKRKYQGSHREKRDFFEGLVATITACTII